MKKLMGVFNLEVSETDEAIMLLTIPCNQQERLGLYHAYSRVVISRKFPSGQVEIFGIFSNRVTISCGKRQLS